MFPTFSAVLSVMTLATDPRQVAVKRRFPLVDGHGSAVQADCPSPISTAVFTQSNSS